MWRLIRRGLQAIVRLKTYRGPKGGKVAGLLDRDSGFLVSMMKSKSERLLEKDTWLPTGVLCRDPGHLEIHRIGGIGLKVRKDLRNGDSTQCKACGRWEFCAGA